MTKSAIISAENLQSKIAKSMETKGNEELLATTKNNLQPKQVWSILVENLKQNGHKTLFSLCGGLRNVLFEENALVVTIEDEVSYDILNQKDNFERVDDFLKKINEKLELKIRLNKKNGNIEKNIEKLKSLFDNNLFVK